MKIRIWLAVVLAIAVLPFAAWAVSNPGAARAHLISHSDFRELDERLFVSPSFADAGAERLIVTIRDAEARVAELFGAYSAAPWIIVAADPESSSRYSFNTHATIHATPFGRTYVVLGPDGMSDTDVIAHELAHAEHLERVGFLLWWLTPSWFVEGLAMQVDHRPKYSESMLEGAMSEGKTIPDVMEMVSFAQFGSGNLSLNYAAARRAVSRIYSRLGPSGLASFLREQRLDTSFPSSLQEASGRAAGS
jgi:hypothetical protein